MSDEPLKAPPGRSFWMRLLAVLAIAGVCVAFLFAGLLCVLPVALLAVGLAVGSATYEGRFERHPFMTPIMRLVGTGLAMCFMVYVGQAYFNVQKLSALRREINAYGGHVYTSGDGMAEIGGPDAVTGVEFFGQRGFGDSQLEKVIPLLNQFPNFLSLNLIGTGVTDAGLKHLKYLRSINQVSLGRTPTTDAGIAELQREMPRLTVYK